MGLYDPEYYPLSLKVVLIQGPINVTLTDGQKDLKTKELNTHAK